MLSKEVVFQYKCDNFYHPESEGTIAWNDIDLNISWRIPLEDVVLSRKDKNALPLKEMYSDVNYFRF